MKVSTHQYNMYPVPAVEDRREVDMVGALRILIPCFLVFCGNVPPEFLYAEDSSPADPEPIELLEIIEVTGKMVETAPRNFSFSLPRVESLWPPSDFRPTGLSDVRLTPVLPPSPSRVLIDPTGEARGRYTQVKPLKMERPLYPRMAREQGWHGTVTLRARITPDGSVDTAVVQQSSGFPMLDDSALQAVKGWTFEPAKNGEFAVASTIALPIRFDLLQ